MQSWGEIRFQFSGPQSVCSLLIASKALCQLLVLRALNTARSSHLILHVVPSVPFLPFSLRGQLASLPLPLPRHYHYIAEDVTAQGADSTAPPLLSLRLPLPL
jgi:hypothetical protein